MRKILIVDDEPCILLTLEKLLKSHDYSVLLAENGYSGLLEAINNIPDLIFIDLYMPVMNGFKLIDELKKHIALRQIPIIILTAYKDTKSIMECNRKGIAYYIIKPYDDNELLSKVEKTIGH